MAKTDKEIAQYAIARIEAIESILNIAFPSFALDYVEETKRLIDANSAISGTAKTEIRNEMDQKLNDLKSKRPK